METAVTKPEHKDWYVTDDEAYILDHMGEKGFTLKAVRSEKMLGFLIVHRPGLEPEHLGDCIGLTDLEKHYSAYMDSACVCQEERGKGLMRRLLVEAEEVLTAEGNRHLFATVHPQNRYSLGNFLAMGYRIAAEGEKYGGLPRVIVYKEINLPEMSDS